MMKQIWKKYRFQCVIILTMDHISFVENQSHSAYSSTSIANQNKFNGLNYNVAVSNSDFCNICFFLMTKLTAFCVCDIAYKNEGEKNDKIVDCNVNTTIFFFGSKRDTNTQSILSWIFIYIRFSKLCVALLRFRAKKEKREHKIY